MSGHLRVLSNVKEVYDEPYSSQGVFTTTEEEEPRGTELKAGHPLRATEEREKVTEGEGWEASR